MSYSPYVLFFSPLSAHCDVQHYQVVEESLDSYDKLVDLLESIEHFLNRLDIYTRIPLSATMTDLVIQILVELLSTLALATKQIKQGISSESVFGDVLY